MQIQELRLHNFMNVSNALLTFNEGLNAIGGANGMGKSTLFSAIAFCLTESKRGDSWKDFIKIGEKSMSVQMILYKYKGDEPMIFDYSGNATSGSMTKTITYKGNFYKNDACATFLASYFDMEMLENIVFHLQDSENIASLSPSKRRDLLKKIFNSDFTEIAEKVKNDITLIKEEISKKEVEVETLKSLKLEYSELQVIESYQLQKIIDSSILISSLEAEIQVLRDLINNKKMTLSQAQQIYASLAPQLDLLEKQKTSLSAEISRNKTAIPVKETTKKMTEETLITLRAEEISYQESIPASKKSLEEHGKTVTETSEEVKKIQTKYAEVTAHYNLVAKQVSAFANSPTCPTCGQECSVEHKTLLTTQLDELCLEKDKLQQSKAEAEKKANEALALYTNTQGIITLRDKESLNRKNKISNSENAIIALTAELLLLDTAIQKDTQSLKDVEERLNDVRTQLDNNRAVLDTIPVINSEISTCQHDIDTKTQQIQAIKDEVRSIESAILLNAERERNNKLLEAQEKENKARIQTLTQQIIERTNEITDLTYIRKVYETELPNHIMMKACALLEGEMNSFLSKTKEGFVCKLTQNSKGIEFFYKARNEPEFLKAKMASGFEALLLTVAFKVSVASAYNTKFIVFDEIDKTATEQSSLKMFETVTSLTGFEQMFVITHRPKSLNYLLEMGAKVYEANNGEFKVF